jgi:hypothetical protein
VILPDFKLRELFGDDPAIQPDEEWRSVPGYEARYQVSSLGNVRSIGVGGNGKQGRILKPMASTRFGQTYQQVAFYRNGVRHYFKVHHLVLLAFVGPRQPGYEVNHIDGDGSNNRRDNLEYVTRSENLKHAYQNGLMNTRGDRNPAAILTWTQVEEIRHRFRSGESTGRALAREFKVSPSTISFVVTGGTWRMP